MKELIKYLNGLKVERLDGDFTTLAAQGEPFVTSIEPYKGVCDRCERETSVKAYSIFIPKLNYTLELHLSPPEHRAVCEENSVQFYH
ncbi:MAG: hypothetical protein V3V78_03845 [Candidatus Woesearchaeota archaeon]